jgi:hypothetical protein
MKIFITFLFISLAFVSCKKTKQDELSVTVSIPNAFVPNNKDGTLNSTAPCLDGEPNCNKVFRVFITNPDSIQLQLSMEIYDLKGRRVFTSRDQNPEWDGTEKNTGVYFCPQGTYHYFITVTEVPNDKTRSYEGDVALLR